MNFLKLFSLPIALFFLSFAHGRADVVLQDTYAPSAPLGIPALLDGGSGPFGYEINFNTTTDFSAAGHGKLVLVLSSKNEDQGGESDVAGAPVSTITYAGVPLTEAMFHDGESFDRVSVGIYYLDNVVSDGTLRIEFADGNQTEFGFGLYALDGLKPGVQDVAEGTSDSAATVTVSTSQGFVVQEAARNNQSMSGGGGYTTLYNYSVQSYRGLSQYQLTTADGDYFAPINNTGTYKYIGGAAFEAIPELSSLNYDIIQIGSDIEGGVERVESGRSVSLSADGMRIAIRSADSTDPGLSRTAIYERTGTTWQQLGTDIAFFNGVPNPSSENVSLSADGSRVVIGAPKSDENGLFWSGSVRVYQWSGTVWQQVGASINGLGEQDYNGNSVSISADGNRLAIGAPMPFNDGAGYTRIYEWTGTAWQQLGTNILGDFTNDDSGESVSLSADGNRVAVGALNNDSNGEDSGKVRIYEWSGASWQQLGSDQNGDAAGANAGSSVSMNQDGSLVAIGIPRPFTGEPGMTRILEWTGTAWQQRGSDILGGAADDLSGASVALSANGNRVAIGAPSSDENGTESGRTRIYQWTGTDWRQIGINIDGDASLDVSGHGVSMNADGSFFAIGAPQPSSSTVGTGYTRIYQIQAVPVLVESTYDPVTGMMQVSMKGEPGQRYKFVEASDLDFASPDQDPVPLTSPALLGTLDGNVVILNGSGDATVQLNLGTSKNASFVRAELVP